MGTPQPALFAARERWNAGDLDGYLKLYDEACTTRFTMTGRHDGEFMAVPAAGTQMALPGITILHFQGDRVVERFSQADMLGLLVQIGAVPAPA